MVVNADISTEEEPKKTTRKCNKNERITIII